MTPLVSLVVDNFGVKYVGKDHGIHLKNTIEENYNATTEWDGRRYIGITLDWYYKRRQVNLSVPNYVTKYLKQLKHKLKKRQHQPYPSAPIIYGSKKQYSTSTSTAPFLDNKGKKFIQQVCGKFIFLGRSVDSTLLCPIARSKSTQYTSRTPLRKITL